MNSQKFSQQQLHFTNTITSTTDSQTYLEISKTAFDHNIAYYKNRIGYQNSLAIVIKGNGYGHGLQQMAYLCNQNTYVDWICVAQLSEALSIQTISKPILVLGYNDVNAANIIGKNIHCMIDSIEYAHTLNTIGKRHNYQFNVHLKVDTGLSRMGVLVSDALTLIMQLQKLDYIKISGIYSHFSASNDNPQFTQQQLIQFNTMLALLDKQNMTVKHVHMSNSAAISNIEYPAHYNFFRLGLGAYGLGPEAPYLKKVMTWKTHITAIKTIPADSYVSYAGTYKTNRTTRIALLPIGYCDGYSFRFSNKTSVLINGDYAPVLGRIAMNITIVDVTDIVAHTGDEVILLGNYPYISAQELANTAEITNVREVLTGINSTLIRNIVD